MLLVGSLLPFQPRRTERASRLYGENTPRAVQLLLSLGRNKAIRRQSQPIPRLSVPRLQLCTTLVDCSFTAALGAPGFSITPILSMLSTCASNFESNERLGRTAKER